MWVGSGGNGHNPGEMLLLRPLRTLLAIRLSCGSGPIRWCAPWWTFTYRTLCLRTTRTTSSLPVLRCGGVRLPTCGHGALIPRFPHTKTKQETCAQAGSESGSLRASNNTIYDLAFARRVLRTVLEWSSTLHIDLDKQPLWTHVLENLAPYPTATSETGATVFAQANFTDGIPSAKNPECARYIGGKLAFSSSFCLFFHSSHLHPLLIQIPHRLLQCHAPG